MGVSSYENFKIISRLFKGSLKNVSRKLKEYLMRASTVFNSFKDFQVSVEVVSGKSHGSVQSVQ